MHEIAHIFLTSPSETLSKETGNILPPYYNLNELFCNDFTLMFLYDRVSTGTFVGTYFGKKEVDHVKLQGSIEARRQFILRLFEKIGVKPFVKAFPSRQLRLKEHILPLDKDKIDPPRQNGQMKPIGLRGPSFGGIDFRHFPIVIQAIGNLNANLGDPSFDRLSNINLDSEWRDIENLVNSGVIPSAERIKEYVRASCYKGAIDRDTDKVILCISEILRLEEERYLATESMLKDILVVIESVGYTQQLKTAFLGSGS